MDAVELFNPKQNKKLIKEDLDLIATSEALEIASLKPNDSSLQYIDTSISNDHKEKVIQNSKDEQWKNEKLGILNGNGVTINGETTTTKDETDLSINTNSLSLHTPEVNKIQKQVEKETFVIKSPPSENVNNKSPTNCPESGEEIVNHCVPQLQTCTNENIYKASLDNNEGTKNLKSVEELEQVTEINLEENNQNLLIIDTKCSSDASINTANVGEKQLEKFVTNQSKFYDCDNCRYLISYV